MPLVYHGLYPIVRPQQDTIMAVDFRALCTFSLLFCCSLFQCPVPGKQASVMASTEGLGLAIQEELDRAKNNLKGLDDSLQRFLGRDPADPR